MKTLVAAGQMTSTGNKAHNLSQCEALITRASALGAKLLSLPENFAYFGNNQEDVLTHAEELSGATVRQLEYSAKRHSIWLSLGGFQERIAGSNKIYNTHIVINPEGMLVASYRKIHLFSAVLPDGSHYSEICLVSPGDKVVSLRTNFFNLGLSICYDLRFPELFWALRVAGAHVMLIPAAFTDLTGAAHWEVLLRARAIETQSYIIAAAQIGQHNARRKSYGHTMIVDPWGAVIAQCSNTEDLALAEIDVDYVHNLRAQMPIKQHRRSLN